MDQRPRAIAASSFMANYRGRDPSTRPVMRRLGMYAYKIDYVNYNRSINVEKLISLNSPTTKAVSLLSLYGR